MRITMSSPIAILLFILFSGGTTTAFVTPRHYQHNNDNYYYLNPQQRTHNSFSSAFVITSNHKVLRRMHKLYVQQRKNLRTKKLRKKLGYAELTTKTETFSMNSPMETNCRTKRCLSSAYACGCRLRQGIGFQSDSFLQGTKLEVHQSKQG